MALTRASAAVVKTEELVNNRNRIINGDMRIAQRGAAGGTGAFINYIDQFSVGRDGGTTGNSFSQSSDAPVGFANSALLTVTATNGSPGATNYFEIRHAIEANNMYDFLFGTVNAQTVVLSFWVKSSVTGTFGGAFNNSGFNYCYPFSYAINSANTWEYKTITITGATAGTWLTGVNAGCYILWSLGLGSTYLGTSGAWTATRKQGVTGQVQLWETNGATFRLTGVQLEVGSTATPFEHRPYGTELALCQRYYQRIDGFFAVGFNSTTMTGSINFPIEMRSSPTITVSGALETTDFVTANFTQSSGNATISGAGARVSARGVMTDLANFSSLTNHRVYGNLPQINRLLLSAEL
jgi:hypothetical protein